MSLHVLNLEILDKILIYMSFIGLYAYHAFITNSINVYLILSKTMLFDLSNSKLYYDEAAAISISYIMKYGKRI